MKTSTAILAGAAFIAVTAHAQPKDQSPKTQCPPGVSCTRSDTLAKGERKEPEVYRKPLRTRSAAQPVSPIEGFDLHNIHVFGFGDLQASCAVDRKRSALTMRTKVAAGKRANAYAECCYEHTEGLPMEAGTTAAASLYISHAEDRVQVSLEESSGVYKSYLHRGKLAVGSHRLASEKVDLPEVRRLCAMVFGGAKAVPHYTWLVIKRVTFDEAADR